MMTPPRIRRDYRAENDATAAFIACCAFMVAVIALCLFGG